MTHRTLITGISGFVGGFLAEYLLDCGDAILGCSLNGGWDQGASETIRDGVELVAWDLGDPGGISKEGRRGIEAFRPDVLYHLAALSVPADCGDDRPTPSATAVNVDGTHRVLELAASLPSRPRVLFISSSHVYAPVSRQAPQVDENAPLGPVHGYGRTKLAAEGEVRHAIKENGCDGVIVRAFQHTGPRQLAQLMLPQWARQFAEAGAGPVRVHTCDAQIDLTDVRDVVRAYRLLAERGRSGEVYNVGSGVSRSSGDVLELLRRLAGSDRPIEQTHPGFKQDPIADITRLTRLTGWRATLPLEKTVSDTLAYWRQQVR